MVYFSELVHKSNNNVWYVENIYIFFYLKPCKHCITENTTVAERAQCAANRKKNTFKLRKQLPQFYNAHASNAHNTTKKRNVLQIKCIWSCCEHLQCVSLFVCVVSICTICCQTDENIFLICWCFFYLHVFSEVAAR